MADIQDLLTKARTLGEALAAHPCVRAHFDTQRAVRSDAAAQKVLQDYQTQLNTIRDLEAQRKPVEASQKQQLRSLEMAMAGQESLKALMRTQADYVALMNQVNQAIDAPMGTLATPEPGA